jgi:hypothetical protein
MTRGVLFTVLLLATPVAAAPPGADSAHAGLSVSVQVVRSCRVQSGGSNATLDCGAQPSTVQVSVNGGQPTLKTLEGGSGGQAAAVAATPEGTRTLTLNF